MKKFVKALIIGTAIVVLGATAVFAAGAGNGSGSGTGRRANQASQESSVSAAAPGNISCREDGRCYQDLDNDGVCDYYNTYTGGDSARQQQAEGRCGFQNGRRSAGRGCSSRCWGFCR